MDFHKDGTLPSDPDVIFVFGSNLAGRHGRGAAKVAWNLFGAEYGVGVGVKGNSYAIPTKDKRVHTLNLETIKGYVNEFLKFAHANQHRSFFVTRVGCVLAGFADSQIAPLFKGAPDNCSFPEEWRKYLTETETTAAMFE